MIAFKEIASKIEEEFKRVAKEESDFKLKTLLNDTRRYLKTIKYDYAYDSKKFAIEDLIKFLDQQDLKYDILYDEDELCFCDGPVCEGVKFGGRCIER